MFLLLSVGIFICFAANVVVGSTTGQPFLSDVQEMLVLFGAVTAFVIEILRREATAKSNQS